MKVQLRAPAALAKRTASSNSISLSKTERRNARFEEKSEDEWTDADRTNKERKEKHDAWQASVDEGKTRVEELNARFADWYYVISSDAFDKIHSSREDLVKKKVS